MVRITFIEHNGKEHVVEASPGISLMQNAVRNDVPGIDAECGGACSCATCHVYIDPAWLAVTGEPETIERSMMEFSSHPEANSRLSCQITVTEQLNGLVVRIPESQG
jgi:2Fe-2S ferredoxin